MKPKTDPFQFAQQPGRVALPVRRMVAFVAVAAAAMVASQFGLLYQTADLACSRAPGGGGDCVVTRQEGFHHSEERFPSHDLTGAKIDEVALHTKYGIGRGLRIVLVRNGGETPLQEAFQLANEGTYRDMAARIVAFTRNPHVQELRVSDHRGRQTFLNFLVPFGIVGPILFFLVLGLVARQAALGGRTD